MRTNHRVTLTLRQQLFYYTEPLSEQSSEQYYPPQGNTLRKLAHAINRYFLALKIENFQLKNFDIFLIFAQNIDCGYTLEPPWRGSSNEYPQSMFWSKNKKNRYTPAYPSFAI